MPAWHRFFTYELFYQSPLFQCFYNYPYDNGSEKDNAPDRPTVMGVAVLVARVGAEDHAGEESDCEAAQSRDRIQVLPEK